MPTLNHNLAGNERSYSALVAIAVAPAKCDIGQISEPNALLLDEGTGFKAMKLFLEAYWERGDRTSDDLAALLGSLDIDPAQRSDWATAVSRALADDS